MQSMLCNAEQRVDSMTARSVATVCRRTQHAVVFCTLFGRQRLWRSGCLRVRRPLILGAAPEAPAGLGSLRRLPSWDVAKVELRCAQQKAYTGYLHRRTSTEVIRRVWITATCGLQRPDTLWRPSCVRGLWGWLYTRYHAVC